MPRIPPQLHHLSRPRTLSSHWQSATTIATFHTYPEAIVAREGDGPKLPGSFAKEPDEAGGWSLKVLSMSSLLTRPI
jgi:hypothetical protein